MTDAANQSKGGCSRPLLIYRTVGISWIHECIAMPIAVPLHLIDAMLRCIQGSSSDEVSLTS